MKTPTILLAVAALALAGCASPKPPQKPDTAAVSGNLNNIGNSLDRSAALVRQIEEAAKANESR